MNKMFPQARELLGLVDEFELEEIELEVDGLVFKAGCPPSAAPRPVGSQPGDLTPPGPALPPLQPAEAASPAAGQHEGRRDAPAASPPGTETRARDNFQAIVSPMVGTFYRSPTPDKPPYVSVGDAVEPETTVCIVEAMKLMNEIKAGVRGRIAGCAVENQASVKAGQTLFLFEPV